MCSSRCFPPDSPLFPELFSPYLFHAIDHLCESIATKSSTLIFSMFGATHGEHLACKCHLPGHSLGDFLMLLSYIRNLLEYSCLRFAICSIIQQECEKGMFEDIIAPLDGYENSGFDNIVPRTNFIRDFGIRNSRTSSVRSYDEEDWIWASVPRQCSTFQWRSNATSVHLLLRFKHYGCSWILQHEKYSNTYSYIYTYIKKYSIHIHMCIRVE